MHNHHGWGVVPCEVGGGVVPLGGGGGVVLWQGGGEAGDVFPCWADLAPEMERPSRMRTTSSIDAGLNY